MANPILESLRAEVSRNRDVDASAVALINGIAARIDAAVKKALENGATAEELQPLTAEVDALKASNQQLADAITANTPAGEPSDPNQPAAGRRP